MELLTTEQIEEHASKWSRTQTGHIGEKERGFIKGAEWMEEQLEPMITELAMTNQRLKESLREIIGSYKGHNFRDIIYLAEQALKAKDK